jgi:hypothetical protein
MSEPVDPLQRYFEQIEHRSPATRAEVLGAFPALNPKEAPVPNPVEKRIERAAEKRAAARAEFEASIVAARESGLSFAAIAKLSDLSVEGVRKITQRQS